MKTTARLFLIAMLVIQAVASAADRPNVLFIFNDDQRADTIAALGNPVIKTPNPYEHSLRVPLIISGPGIAADKRTDAMCYLFDVMPMLGAMCGVPAHGG